MGNANAHKDLYNNNGKGRYRYEVPRLSYEGIRKIMERRLTLQKRELLTEREIGHIVQDWEDGIREEEINKRIIAREAKRIEKKFKKYNVPMLGNMPREKDEGRCMFLYCQLNNASTKVVRDIKMDSVQRLNERYDIDIDLFAEMGTNFTVGGASNNMGSWFKGREKRKFATAHNIHDPNKSKYQPGGTGVMIRGPMAQYARHGSQDPRKLGRLCSYVFWANPSHKFRVVVAYNICTGKPEGLQRQYQQITRFCQNNNIDMTPTELFRQDFAAQCGKWRKEGDRLIITMDANEHTMDGELRGMLEAEGVGLVEFSHKKLGQRPATHVYRWKNTHRR